MNELLLIESAIKNHLGGHLIELLIQEAPEVINLIAKESGSHTFELIANILKIIDSAKQDNADNK